MSTTTSLARAVVRSVERHGIRPAELFRHAGTKVNVGVADRDERMPTTAYLRLIASAVELSGNSSFGVEIAKHIDVEAFGLVGFIVASSSTLGEAFQRLSRYARILCDELTVDVVTRGDTVHVVYGMDAEPHVPALFEMALVHFAITSRRGTRGAFAPKFIGFRHPAPVKPWPRAVPFLPRWGVREDALVVARADLALPLKGANAPLLRILEAHATQLLGELPPPGDSLKETRTAVRALLSKHDLALDDVATRLGIGPRTLQRRLRDQGLTFRHVLDDVRRECALVQLAAPGVRVADVAFALGFSSSSAFHHAFRRWTGHAPGRGR